MSEGELPTKIKSPRNARRASGYRVVVFWGDGSVARDLGPNDRLVVGRAEGCGLQVPDESVSRQHVAVHGGSPPRIEDLGSANGTVVGGSRLSAGVAVAIEPLTVAELGDAMLVVRPIESARERTDRPGAGAPPLDPPMVQVQELVDLVAKTDIPVLVLGETGVGKGVVAQAIHARSTRSAKPFLRLNCAAIAETVLESELFGYERGAFTGATQAKPGLLEAAEGGTVFLDEVGDMALPIQAKLLHALDHHEVLRVGALKPRKIDARFIAATNKNLLEEVERGRFRQDLYFRLNGVTITVPPLRERPSEISWLARSFAREACARTGSAEVGISDDALQLLARHPWPGNVRELRNVVVRAALFARGGRIGAEHFAPADVTAKRAEPSALHDQVRDLEARRVAEALEQCKGNQVRAAKLLGISRGTLRSRMKALGLLKA